MFAASSKDSDNNDNGGNGGNGGNGNKPVIPTNTITLDNQQKSISSAQYEKTGENSYKLTLFLSDDKKERVELELNENLHMKGNSIDLKQKTTDGFWVITYYASHNGEAYLLFEANGSSELDVPFLEGTLTVKGKPNEQININLKNGRLKDQNGEERTFSINYSGKMENYITSNPNSWPIKPIIKQGEKNYITLYTERPLNQEIRIRLKGKKGVWIDLNNNGKQDEEDATPKLDYSQNTYLVKSKVFTLYGEITEFDASNCSLKGIDLSNATALTFLNLQSNNLTKLDLSANKNLKALQLYYNRLEQLDLSQNTALGALYVYGNQLTQLDLSKNTALGDVDLYYNNFTAQAMLAMAKTLHKGKNRKNIVLQASEGYKENNQVDKAVLDELDKKGWSALYKVKGGYLCFYNGDPNAPNNP